MEVLYVVSTESFSGKSAIILCLALSLQKKGFEVGFMKPLSTFPAEFEGALVDEDAYCIWNYLQLEYPPELISPLALSSQAMREHMLGKVKAKPAQIARSFKKIARDKDIMILEGAEDLWKGRCLEFSAHQVAEMLDARVLLIGKAQADSVTDEILVAHDILQQRLIGVILNSAPHSYIEALKDFIVPTLKGKGIEVFGIIPEDKILQAVKVEEIAKHLGGEILCALEKSEELVEEFMVGAMSQENAFRYFRRKPNKAVITGGDRADVQLAALETSTKCLILTGSFRPSPIVLARAQDLGIPMILVDVDTFTAVDKMEALIGHVSIHDERKIKQMGMLLDRHVRLEDLFQSMGLKC